MLIKLVYEGAHAVIPELDDAIVEAGEHPGPLRVKAQPCRGKEREVIRHNAVSKYGSLLAPAPTTSICLPPHRPF